jgi:hypothetical protein
MLILRQRIAILALVIASGFVMVAGGRAQAACYGPQEQLSAQTIADFKADPTKLLDLAPNRTAELISKVRDLAASDPTTLPLILNLIATADPTQIDAIGTGLGQAALTCVRTDQAYANEIQQAVAGQSNDALTLAFAAVLGDKPIGAVGGGGGGVGGGGGPTDPLFGIARGSGGSSSALASFGTSNREPNFFTLSSISGIGPGVPGNTTISITSVSPSR